MWKITEYMYLASLDVVDGPTQAEEFSKNNIKKVLTVATEAVHDYRQVRDVDYQFICVYDMPSQDILSTGILCEALDFIFEAIRANENIVVHCISGISRSVTVCVAHLMLVNNWSMDRAFKMVKSIRKAARPNPGFIAQLKIWERIGMNFNYSFKNLRISIPEVSDADDKTIWLQPVLDNPMEIRYKCRKCRKTLFSTSNICHYIDDRCQKYIIEPMEWLTVSSITCSLTHSCGAKIGTFLGRGARCNGCGKFVDRWIFIDKSKVDEVKASPPPVLEIEEPTEQH